jgi:CHAD domain-containing protein
MMKRQDILTPLEERSVKAGRNGSQLGPGDRSIDSATGLARPVKHPGSQSHHDHNGSEGPTSRSSGHGEAWPRLRKLALRQLNRLVSLEPKVLRDEFPEAVHDLRVASRRLQSLLDFLYPAPRPPQIRKLRGRLKRAREVLGELRNHDVLVARMTRVLARKRAGRRKAWEAGHEYVLKLRPNTVERAHRRLTRLNLAQVYVRLREQLEASSSPESFDTASHPARSAAAPAKSPAIASPQPATVPGKPEDAAARFAERLAKLWNDFDALAAKARRNPDVLHSLRIATKRLRYLVEVAAAMEIAGSSAAVHWLRELQGKLGDWHDLEVLDATLIEMLAHRKFLQDNLPLAIEVERLILGVRGSKTRQFHSYLRKALQSSAFHQTASWVTESAAERPVGAG